MKILVSLFVVWGFMWAGATIATGGELWQTIIHLFCGISNLVGLCLLSSGK